MNKVRIAIIGIGSMGKQYARMIYQGQIKGLELACVCSRSQEAEMWVRANLSQELTLYKTGDQMFEAADSFDALLIVTPHRLHPALAIKAFSLGKHVLCDKPAGISLMEANQMNLAAEAAGKVFSMVFHQRFFDKYCAIKKILENDGIGSIKRILLEDSKAYRTAHYHQSADWRSSWDGEGGGLLINQGQHLLDIWQWLFGMPDSVNAAIPFGKYNDFLVDDEATLVMEYPDKQMAVFIVSSGEGHSVQRLEVIGTKGRILLDDSSLHYWRFDKDIREYGRDLAVTSREGLKEEYLLRNFPAEDPDKAKALLIQNFTDAILKGVPLVVDGTEGQKALEIMAGAYLSAWQEERILFPVDKKAYQQALLQKIKEENSVKESVKMKTINEFAKAYPLKELCISNLADNIYLSGLRSILKVSPDEEIEALVLDIVSKFCNEDGSLVGIEGAGEHGLTPMAFGKALSYSYEKTGEEKYLNAMTVLGNKLKKQSRTKTHIFCSDIVKGLSFKELYEVLPFYVEFETKYHRKEQYNDIIDQFKGARREYLELPKQGAWGKKAWYMMALLDAFSEISEESFHHYKALSQFFKECWGNVKIDFETFKAEADDNVKLIVAYAVLKGCRFEALLAEKHLRYGRELFEEIDKDGITELMTAGLYMKAGSEIMMAAAQ